MFCLWFSKKAFKRLGRIFLLNIFYINIENVEKEMPEEKCVAQPARCFIIIVYYIHFSNFSGEPKNKISQKPF
jgi:hypothetical protein